MRSSGIGKIYSRFRSTSSCNKICLQCHKFPHLLFFKNILNSNSKLVNFNPPFVGEMSNNSPSVCDFPNRRSSIKQPLELIREGESEGKAPGHPQAILYFPLPPTFLSAGKRRFGRKAEKRRSVHYPFLPPNGDSQSGHLRYVRRERGVGVVVGRQKHLFCFLSLSSAARPSFLFPSSSSFSVMTPPSLLLPSPSVRSRGETEKERAIEGSDEQRRPSGGGDGGARADVGQGGGAPPPPRRRRRRRRLAVASRSQERVRRSGAASHCAGAAHNKKRKKKKRFVASG